MSATRLATIEDIEALGEDARVDVIKGELYEVAAASGRHGEVSAAFAGNLWQYGSTSGPGRAYTAETAIIIEQDPLTFLVPEVAFINAERFADGRAPMEGFVEELPDVVVEVVSPSQSLPEVLGKVAIYQQRGVPLVWVAHPTRRGATSYRLGRTPRYYGEDDVLDGGDVLPGFAVAVARFFE